MTYLPLENNEIKVVLKCKYLRILLNRKVMLALSSIQELQKRTIYGTTVQNVLTHGTEV